MFTILVQQFVGCHLLIRTKHDVQLRLIWCVVLQVVGHKLKNRTNKNDSGRLNVTCNTRLLQFTLQDEEIKSTTWIKKIQKRIFQENMYLIEFTGPAEAELHRHNNRRYIPRERKVLFYKPTNTFEPDGVSKLFSLNSYLIQREGLWDIMIIMSLCVCVYDCIH